MVPKNSGYSVEACSQTHTKFFYKNGTCNVKLHSYFVLTKAEKEAIERRKIRLNANNNANLAPNQAQGRFGGAAGGQQPAQGQQEVDAPGPGPNLEKSTQQLQGMQVYVDEEDFTQLCCTLQEM